MLDDALVMVSELATNPTRYAPGPYQLRLQDTRTEHVVEIHDRGLDLPSSPPPQQSATPVLAAAPEDCGGGLDALLRHVTEGGRGLQIVDQLSDGCWGFRPRPGGKLAWFTIAAELH